MTCFILPFPIIHLSVSAASFQNPKTKTRVLPTIPVDLVEVDNPILRHCARPPRSRNPHRPIQLNAICIFTLPIPVREARKPINRYIYIHTHTHTSQHERLARTKSLQGFQPRLHRRRAIYCDEGVGTGRLWYRMVGFTIYFYNFSFFISFRFILFHVFLFFEVFLCVSPDEQIM